MDPNADVAAQLAGGISTAIISMVASMLTRDIGFLAFVSLFVTQGIKTLMIYIKKSPSVDMIWFVIGPLGSAPFAFIMWKVDGIHWFAAACGASMLANMFYALFLKRILGGLSPAAYERMNVPIERRKRETDPPDGRYTRKDDSKQPGEQGQQGDGVGG
jgi:hypothetical protein